MKTQTVLSSAIPICGLLFMLAALLGRSSKAQNPPLPHTSKPLEMDAGKPPVVPALTKTAARYRIADLGTLGGSESEAFGINNKGQIVGNAAPHEKATTHAFLYENGQMTDLGLPFDCFSSWATGINNKGVIVGNANSGGPHIVTGHFFVYQQGKMKEIKDARLDGIAAINDAGQYAGSCVFNGYPHACLYRGTIQDLGTLQEEEGGSEAFGLNNKGQVVGSSSVGGKEGSRAVLFTGGKISNLGVLPHHYVSEARGINDRGDIVGWSTKDYQYSPDPRAFLYHDHKMVDLNSLLPANCGWVLSKANGINDLGQIVGCGMYRGKQHAFLLSPLSTKQHLKMGCVIGESSLPCVLRPFFLFCGLSGNRVSLAKSLGAWPLLH